MTADHSIPQDLIPHDGRFGCGPSKVRPEQIQAILGGGVSIMGTSHRKPAVKNVVGDIREGLSELFGLPEGYEIVMSLGGATAFWDAATFGLIQKRSAHLSFGEFSSKFAKAAAQAPWLEDPVVIDSDYGTAPSVAELDSVTDVDVVAWAHNETSTGVMVPVNRPSTPGNPLVLIDATSGSGGLPLAPEEADVYYFSPQKCYAADGGLWVSLMSPAAIDRIESIAASDRFIPAFLNLKTAVDNSRKNQTYNTPAVGTLLMLANQVQWMNANGGLAGMVERTTKNSSIVYDWAEKRSEATPYVSDPEKRSLVVATIDFEDGVDANQLAAILRENGIVDTESYRKLGRNQLRIGLFPAIDAEDVEKLTGALDYILDQGWAAR